MRIRVIARFKNEEFYQARIRAGLTQFKLAEIVGVSLGTIIGYENFQRYPVRPESQDKRKKRWAWIALKLETVLKTPYDMLFPPEYREAIDKKMGHPVYRVSEVQELPEWTQPKAVLEPHVMIETKEMEKAIESVLELLTEREAKILKMRFGLCGGFEHSLEEVGKQFRVSRTRIAQIEGKALRKLKHPSRSKILKNFI